MNSIQRFCTVAAAGLLSGSASAGSHLWDFWEIFSNEDGTIQFMELHVPTSASGETFVGGKKIWSLTTGKQFTFPGNLTGSTSFKYLLLATQGYADLPGSPTPDYIIEDGFFSVNGDTLKYHIYDTFTFTAAQLPTDCVMSLARNKSNNVNTPTNFPGASGTIDACPCPADINSDGLTDGADLGLLLAAWNSSDTAADFDKNGVVDGADLGVLLGGWGECPI
jgi:hypothetical protein